MVRHEVREGKHTMKPNSIDLLIRVAQKYDNGLKFVQRLVSEGVDFVLVGGHAINVATGEVVLTDDADIVIGIQEYENKVKPLIAEIAPKAVNKGVKWLSEELDIDILHPEKDAKWVFADKYARDLNGTKVPCNEALACLKYLASASPQRRVPKRHKDVSAIAALVECPGFNVNKAVKLLKELEPNANIHRFKQLLLHPAKFLPDL